jgi:NAD(P)-dependent dehydrogenase (short-subunit alcohol dehydrogenase family)
VEYIQGTLYCTEHRHMSLWKALAPFRVVVDLLILAPGLEFPVQSIEEMVAKAVDAFGHMDILLNNAGCNVRSPH